MLSALCIVQLRCTKNRRCVDFDMVYESIMRAAQEAWCAARPRPQGGAARRLFGPLGRESTLISVISRKSQSIFGLIKVIHER